MSIDNALRRKAEVADLLEAAHLPITPKAEITVSWKCERCGVLRTWDHSVLTINRAIKPGVRLSPNYIEAKLLIDIPRDCGVTSKRCRNRAEGRDSDDNGPHEEGE